MGVAGVEPAILIGNPISNRVRLPFRHTPGAHWRVRFSRLTRLWDFFSLMKSVSKVVSRNPETELSISPNAVLLHVFFNYTCVQNSAYVFWIEPCTLFDFVDRSPAVRDAREHALPL